MLGGPGGKGVAAGVGVGVGCGVSLAWGADVAVGVLVTAATVGVAVGEVGEGWAVGRGVRVGVGAGVGPFDRQASSANAAAPLRAISKKRRRLAGASEWVGWLGSVTPEIIAQGNDEE